MIEITDTGIGLFLLGLQQQALILRAFDRTGQSIGEDVEIPPESWEVNEGCLVCSVVIEAEQNGICGSYQILNNRDTAFVGYFSDEYEYMTGEMVILRICIEISSIQK